MIDYYFDFLGCNLLLQYEEREESKTSEKYLGT